MYLLDMAPITPTRRTLREAGQFIYEQRRERGLSPEDLATQIAQHSNGRVTISGRTIRRIEEGNRPSVRTMFALAQEFDVKVNDLWPL